MINDKEKSPKQYYGIMVSSTFSDLSGHRAALIAAISSQGFHEIVMENDVAKSIDVIDSSLQLVQDAAAYVGIIGQKYGEIPPCPQRNPTNLSLTEIEFNEALRLNRPILLFIMGDSHLIRKADIETDPTNRAKLNAFRERAKQMGPKSRVHRVYTVFDSLEEFSTRANQAISLRDIT